ncbi:MAG: MazG-like family protein [Candidatus Aenigmatarchaeota archaeon]
MTKVEQETTIRDYQSFVDEIYGLSNDRHFSLGNMLSNIERFTMRGLKGVRKKDYVKTKINLLISLSWFMSLLNRLHIDLEDAVWKRFPYTCSYCASCPCSCKENKVKSRIKVVADNSKKPATLNDFQIMFKNIYPPEKRTVEHAGIHLAEELGEFSESIMIYMGEHKDQLFENVVLESADIFSCIIGMFNSLDINLARELSETFNDNCHVCHKSPCECSFSSVVNYLS